MTSTRGVTAQMRVPWHRRPGVTGEGGELVDVAGVGRPCDPFHDVAADAVEFAGVGGQDVHALLSRQLPDERHGLGATDLDRVEDLVGYAGQRCLREQATGAESVPAGQPASGRHGCGSDETAPIPLCHRGLLL